MPAVAPPSHYSPIDPPVAEGVGSQTVWTQLTGCGDSLALATAAQKHAGVLVVICKDNQTALRLEHELAFFLDQAIPVLHFPNWETLPYDVFSPLPEIVSERLKTLAQLPKLEHGIIVISVSTLMQKLAPREHILANSFCLEIGERLALDDSRQRFEQVGYQCVPQVFQHGEFAVRGSIIDLFPMGSQVPFRIELFDDEVESIRTFDPESQRSLEKVDRINLFPAREFPFTEDSIKQFRRMFRNVFPEASQRINLYQDISKGLAPGGIEYYLPLFVETTETLFDYLPTASRIALLGDLDAIAANFYREVSGRYEQHRHNLDRPLLAPEQLYLSPEQLSERLEKTNRIQIRAAFAEPLSAPHLIAEFITQPLPDLSFHPSHQEPAHRLQEFLRRFPGKILLIAETPGHREAMLENLRKHEIRPRVIQRWGEFLNTAASPCILVAPIDHGLWLENPTLAIITESQLSGERAQQRRRRRTATVREAENLINSLAELNEGSPVVHQDHGVGRYLGLKKLQIGELENEFLTLEYANQDKLYVPVSSLHLISRYSGAGTEIAPLHKLGGDQWSKAKRKAMARVRDVAAELLDINARRALKPGRAFAIGPKDQEAFALGFPFEETPDQLAAIESVTADLTAARTMDRVVCGDVGFGKTEVSMRAAFIVVQNNAQVAVLVPTTLLAQQHYQNFRDRFAEWPVRIEVLSRFIPKKQQDEILQGLAEGKVDIVIGTHKLLQTDIRYKDLGLVIIDEEHRFGVRHKEHFKKLRSELDLLTLTATPIPRTLNMAMSGLRDISIIATPPPNRHAIKTFVSEWVDALVQEACMREIQRGGQVFFLHNDVKSMERMERELAQLIPDARIEIAHGQMPERELERIMLDFYHQRFNLLLCTTIIESGIDVPSANTIIINRADKLGLAQLHQLRGRVGRSHHRAYAYLLVPNQRAMSRDAIKRLEAIEASGDLGAGFMISSHDMEIRGAGELLGDEQSGQIQEIGFTLYTELLERAVSALKSGKQPELEGPMESGPEVDLQMTALIPDDYLPDVHTRLVLYKRIANATSFDALRDLQIEMIDRFGLLPAASKNLFAVNEIKLKAQVLGIQKIEAGNNGGRILFASDPSIDPSRIIELIQTQPQRFMLDGPEKLRFVENFADAAAKIGFIDELMDTLSGA